MFENTGNIFQMECSNNPTVLRAKTCDVLRLITFSLINGGYNTSPVCGGYLNMNSGTYDPSTGELVQPYVGATISIRNVQSGVVTFTQFGPTDNEFLLPNLAAGTYEIIFIQNFDNTYPPDGAADIYYRTCPVTLIIEDAITDVNFSAFVKGNQCTSREVCIQSLQPLTKAQSQKYIISFSGAETTFDCLNFGNNGLCPISNCFDQVCFTYPANTNGWRNVTITYNGERCTLSKTIPIYIGSTDITAVGEVNGCSGSTAQISATTTPANLPIGTTIQWQPTTGLSNPNILNPVVTFGTSPIVYTLTVTLPNGCLATTTVTATPFQCCQTQAGGQQYFGSPNNPFDLSTLPPQALVSKTTPIILNGHFTINAQNLTTNNTVSFANCSNVLLSPGATITVPDGKKLIINNSHLKACDSKLWQGIVMPTATSEIEVVNGSIIEQAEIAVRSQNGAKLSIEGSIFDNNYVSVQIENGGDFYNGTIHYSKFLCSANSLLPPRTGLKPTSGVQLFNTNGMTIGLSSNQPQDYNEFDNLNNGINALNSSVTVYANKFTNIKVWDTPDNNHHGAGVYAATPGIRQGFWVSYPNSYVVVRTYFFKPLAATAPTFTNCDRAIHLQMVNAQVFYNPIQDVKDGILLQDARRKEATIYHNYIENADRGITSAASFSSKIHIHNNIINLTLPPLVSPNLNWQTVLNEANPPLQFLNSHGIQASDFFFLPNVTYKIYNNTINSGRFGIHLLNTSANALVYNNNITLSDSRDNIGNYAGIYAENCNGSQIFQNGVTGDGAEHIIPWLSFGGARLFTTQVASQYRKSGILLYNSPNMLLSCNGANNIGYATHFIGNCETQANRIRENSHGNSRFGLVLERSLGNYGFIGRFVGTPNYVNNNSFNGNYTGGFATYNWTTDDPNALDFVPTFFYRAGGAPTPFPNGNSIGSQWLSIQARVAYTNSGFNQCYTSGNGGGGAGSGREAIDVDLAQLIAEGALNFGEYDAVSKWKEEFQLYAKLAELERKQLAAEPLSQEDSISLADPVLANFAATKQTEVIGKLENIRNLMAKADFDTLLENPYLLPNLLDEIEQKVGALPENSEVYELNHRIMLEFLRRWISEEADTLSEEDWQTIGNLAVACPYEAGTAVYDARVLLSIRQPGLYFDDQLICAQNQYFKNDIDWSQYDLYGKTPLQTFQFARLHYDEATQEAVVNYQLEPNANADMELFDISGKLITAAKLATSQHFYNQPLKTQAGVYIYRIRHPNGFIANGKIVVK